MLDPSNQSSWLSDLFYLSSIIDEPSSFYPRVKSPYLSPLRKESDNKKYEGVDKLGLKSPKNAPLPPVKVFLNGLNKKQNFYDISLGIFDLNPESLVVAVTKNNNIEVKWVERLGEGVFCARIPSHKVVCSKPALSYEGGILNISVPVKEKEDEHLFVSRLVETNKQD